MNTPFPKDQIAGYECRFAVYCPPGDAGDGDLHAVKEVIHLKDGTKHPNLRLCHNFKRPFFITKKGYRTHQDKKEWENLDRTQRFEATQTELARAVCRALGAQYMLDKNGSGNMRRIARNPYIYGTDILSTAVIKRSYQDKYPELQTPYTVATFDVETDVLHGSEEIMMATLSFGSNVLTVIQKRFLAGQTNIQPRLQQLFQKYLGSFEVKKKDGKTEVVDFIKKRNLNWEVLLVDREADVVCKIFERAHELKPDFLAIWNIDFDIPRVLKALERANLNPADVLSDPSVPQHYRYYKYKQGPKQKVTASGKATPIKPSAQWHTLYCPASFYVIDAMCAYRHIRTGSQEEPSYALDAILAKHIGARKLQFEEANGLSSMEWHQFMQQNHPLEYVIYNVWDCVSMEELDEITNDLRLSLPMFSGCSDFENFKSQPRRLADNLHYFCLANGRVMAATSDEMQGEMDKETVGLDGWIVTLPAHLVVDNGLRVISENSLQATNIRAHVGDLDVSASYPNGGAVFNISRETTHKELISIEGVSEYQQRMQGINLSSGPTNAVEICVSLFGLPTLDKLLAAFQTEHVRTINQ